MNLLKAIRDCIRDPLGFKRMEARVAAVERAVFRCDDECPHGFFVGRGCTYGCVDDEGQRADPPQFSPPPEPEHPLLPDVIMLP